MDLLATSDTLPEEVHQGQIASSSKAEVLFGVIAIYPLLPICSCG